MRCLFKYLQIVLTQSVNDLKQMDFANKAIVSYMSIINMLSKLLGVKTNKETDMIKIADTQQSLNGDSIVQGFYSVGGVDYTNEKIFETPHPYPRGDFSSKETYHFSKAIAVQIRFDPRCH